MGEMENIIWTGKTCRLLRKFSNLSNVFGFCVDFHYAENYSKNRKVGAIYYHLVFFKCSNHKVFLIEISVMLLVAALEMSMNVRIYYLKTHLFVQCFVFVFYLLVLLLKTLLSHK